MKTKDNIIKLKKCEHDGQICIECGTSFFKAITQARADERKKVLNILENKLLIKCECEDGDCPNCQRLCGVIDKLKKL